jgi:hypothetical protein
MKTILEEVKKLIEQKEKLKDIKDIRRTIRSLGLM